MFYKVEISQVGKLSQTLPQKYKDVYLFEKEKDAMDFFENEVLENNIIKIVSSTSINYEEKIK